MASENLKKSIPLLQSFSQIREAKKRKIFLNTFETRLQRALREICYNLLHGNIKLTDEEKKRVEKFKVILRIIANKKTKKDKFRRVIVQKGRGLLPALIPLVLTALESLI